MKKTSKSSLAQKPKLSLSGVPTIPSSGVMRWEDWLAGRKARRLTGMINGPEVIRRQKSSADRRLRRLYNGERGLPFTPVEKL